MLDLTYKKNRIKHTIETLLKDIKHQSLPVRAVIIFGSIATNTFDENSDLDICIIHHGEGDYCIDTHFAARMEVESYLGEIVEHELNIDFVHTTKKGYDNGKYVFESVRQEGRVIYGEL